MNNCKHLTGILITICLTEESQMEKFEDDIALLSKLHLPLAMLRKRQLPPLLLCKIHCKF